MALAAGARLGSYEVAAPIGRGGFGEVYRARDTRLDRDVAIKVLADFVAEDRERMARFEREAKLLASLNHPNIAAIYGLEEAGGVRALILELVEGPTLAERLSGGPLPPDTALAIARQIAVALEAAHEQGVVHRDLKPANVKVKAEGTVKVLDFGLAKALAGDLPAAELAESPTVVDSGTREGVVLGTAAYMSPEQARGQAVDKRADIWAFGCVLYELLSGQRAFPGDSAADVLARILERAPDFDALPSETPPRVRTLLRRCLTKDPRQRLRDIGDARLEIDELPGAGEERATAEGIVRESRSAKPGWAAITLGALLLAALAGLAGWRLGSGGATLDRRPARLDLALPEEQELLVYVLSPVVLSPDGRRIAYVARTDEGTFLYLRSLDSFEPTRVAGSEGAEAPFFSPDGEWVAFRSRANARLAKVPVAGGAPVTIGPAPGVMLGASWGPDDTIVFSDSTSSGLFRVSADGGVPTPLTRPDVSMSAGHRFPYHLPDGSGVLFTATSDDEPQLALLPVGSSDWRVIATGDARFSGMRYLASGHLVYGQADTIFMAPFDPDTGELTGAPRPVVTDVGSSPISQHSFFSVSDAGTLAYIPAAFSGTEGSLVWLDAAGDREEIARAPGAFGYPRLSPDGRHVAASVRSSGPMDVWVYDVERGGGIRLTRGVEARYPVWAPASSRLVLSLDTDLYTVSADGTAPPELLLSREGEQWPLSWSPDGRFLLFAEEGPGTSADILSLAIDGGEVVPLVATAADERDASLSPNGRWVGYVSDETGRDEVYVQSFPPGGGKERVTLEGGHTPRWSADSRKLFFRRGDDVFAVPISEAGRPGDPERVASLPAGVSLDLGYDVGGEGREIVAPENPDTAAAVRLRVVLDWLADLERHEP